MCARRISTPPSAWKPVVKTTLLPIVVRRASMAAWPPPLNLPPPQARLRPIVAADEPHLAEGAELVAEFDVAADLGVVEVDGDALLLDVVGFDAVEGEAAAEVEVAADLGVDEIEAAEDAGREQVNVFGDLHAAGLDGGRAAVADVELLQLRVADVDAVVEAGSRRT